MASLARIWQSDEVHGIILELLAPVDAPELRCARCIRRHDLPRARRPFDVLAGYVEAFPALANLGVLVFLAGSSTYR